MSFAQIIRDFNGNMQTNFSYITDNSDLYMLQMERLHTKDARTSFTTLKEVKQVKRLHDMT